MTETRNALIVGAGAGLSASLARKARAEGLDAAFGCTKHRQAKCPRR